MTHIRLTDEVRYKFATISSEIAATWRQAGKKYKRITDSEIVDYIIKENYELKKKLQELESKLTERPAR
jgi:ribosomal protein L9